MSEQTKYCRPRIGEEGGAVRERLREDEQANQADHADGKEQHVHFSLCSYAV